MTVRALTRREHRFALCAVAVAVALAYGLLRYLPAQRALVDMVRQADEAEASAKEMTLPPEPLGSLERLDAEHADLQRALDQAREALAALDRRFVPLDQPEAFFALQVELASLARASGLRIVRHVSYEPGADQTAGVTGTRPNVAPERPMRELEAATTYEAFRRFVQGLSRLSKPVAVVQWRLERADPSDTGSGPLKAVVVLAL